MNVLDPSPFVGIVQARERDHRTASADRSSIAGSLRCCGTYDTCTANHPFILFGERLHCLENCSNIGLHKRLLLRHLHTRERLFWLVRLNMRRVGLDRGGQFENLDSGGGAASGAPNCALIFSPNQAVQLLSCGNLLLVMIRPLRFDNARSGGRS
jgi:hypothetical protein